MPRWPRPSSRFVTSDDDPPVLVFADDDPTPLAFPRLSLAGSYMEHTDVIAGGYTGVFTLDGRWVEVIVNEKDFDLIVREASRAEELTQRLRDHDATHGPAPTDPVAFANKQFARDWNSRWLKRPRWLSERLHGSAPPQF